MELAETTQMADMHPVFQSSIPIHSSCLETKMASLDIESRSSGNVSDTTGGLINGKFDIESLIAELTIEEKASLLSGMVVTQSKSLRVALDNMQGRISGTLRKFQD